MIDTHKQVFIEEAVELLFSLETSLLELEEVPDDKELIARVFRALHTIKGSAGMFGYDEITMFTHDIESVFDHIRKGEINITKEIIDLTLSARDQILLMLSQTEKTENSDDETTKALLTSFRKIILEYNAKTNNSETPKANNCKPATQSIQGIKQTFYISFKPSLEIFLSGTNPLLLLNEIRALGNSIVIGNENVIPMLGDIDPQKCYMNWDIVLKTEKGIDAIKDVFIFAVDHCDNKILTIDNDGKLNDSDKFAEFEKQCIEKSKSQPVNIEKWLSEFEPALNTESLHKTSKKEKNKTKDNSEVHHELDTVSSIRVSAEKLDDLVNLVGELVTIQARLSQIAANNNDTNIMAVSEEVERITWSLRDSALNIRMLPIGSTFNKFNRLVRDLSKELGKVIELTTEGAETELDKTVIERLNDPLIHIIRNCIDHGIESSEIREKHGKPKTGLIHLSASQSGGSVLIKISDDGAGIDKDAVRLKALNLGMIQENAELTDQELYGLIFTAGFSTAKTVTNVSGRGVGMDVVRRAIDNLRGNIEVNSKKNEGTVITLKLPLTLAIIDGLLVKIDDDHFVLPLSSVEECVELSEADLNKSHGRHIVNIRGEIVPYINLRERFEIEKKRPEIEQVVIAGIKGTRIGFVVDKVIGQHQTVLKTLGKAYKNVEGVSGATILGDGSVALILDILKLAEKEEMEERIGNLTYN
jgi:two-component system chemotaxis sensor kinase CheA